MPLRLSPVRSRSTAPTLLAWALFAVTATAQEPPRVWLRLDPFPADLTLTSRESFDGVPLRFLALTDGSIYLGGRRDVLRGWLDKPEMQALAVRFDAVRKSFKKAPIPSAISVGEGPATLRLSVFDGAPVQVVIMGRLPASPEPLAPLPDFVRRLTGFRHPSLRPFVAPEFTMIVKEKTLIGGCRSGSGLPPLAQALSSEVVVPEVITHGFPTGADMAQVCEGPKRYTVVFRPLLPGER